MGEFMSFTNVFDEAMQEADSEIMAVFGNMHTFTLPDDSVKKKLAIFDTKQVQQQGKESIFKEMKNGSLTIHGERLSKKIYVDAIVETALGQRRIADIFYPQETTSVLVLSALKKSTEIQPSRGF